MIHKPLIRRCALALLALTATLGLGAQERSLTNTFNSKYARVWGVDETAVHWTGGFWGNRFEVCRDTMVVNMWHIMDDPDLCPAYRNLEIAAGYMEGRHRGPAFLDGDFFKWLESAAAVYAVTRDPALDRQMDEIIETIAKAQREDGYMHTQVVIPERNARKNAAQAQSTAIVGAGGPVGTATATAVGGAFNNRLNFETYNHGHLMTAACVHYRATGKRNLLDVAIKATDFLCEFMENDPDGLARSTICPSHYMGVVEMYRATGDPRYLKLAHDFIDLRSRVKDGTDDNQDRIPFRDQWNAMGHAVRANYLYAGVADVYAETGDETLLPNLESIWEDIVNRKMYITGGCGALYDGTSPDGTSYEPDFIQKVHQAYGRAYQLPNTTAHNETCANIGNLLFNWRMFCISGDGKYNDIVEKVQPPVRHQHRRHPVLLHQPAAPVGRLPLRTPLAQGAHRIHQLLLLPAQYGPHHLRGPELRLLPVQRGRLVQPVRLQRAGHETPGRQRRGALADFRLSLERGRDHHPQKSPAPQGDDPLPVHPGLV